MNEVSFEAFHNIGMFLINPMHIREPSTREIVAASIESMVQTIVDKHHIEIAEYLEVVCPLEIEAASPRFKKCCVIS